MDILTKPKKAIVDGGIDIEDVLKKPKKNIIDEVTFR